MMAENDPIEEKKKVVNPNQKQERVWGIFCHLSAFLLFVTPPIGGILGPLIIWLIKKGDMPLVDTEGKESLNFQISMAIYAFVAFVLCFVAIGVPLMFLLVLANIVLVIIAAIKTSNDEKFRYPCTIRFIK